MTPIQVQDAWQQDQIRSSAYSCPNTKGKSLAEHETVVVQTEIGDSESFFYGSCFETSQECSLEEAGGQAR